MEGQLGSNHMGQDHRKTVRLIAALLFFLISTNSITNKQW